ncbi:hypothetical protein [Sporisorium scitamineum]|uniref:Uncharacterized protein n=1 Tax=Sporisorium scitamineum TaxID=49012 RepID=A0A0F7SD41_9BASI|nr:hypothetical protein [Sporisorium scitamineum]
MTVRRSNNADRQHNGQRAKHGSGSEFDVKRRALRGHFTPKRRQRARVQGLARLASAEAVFFARNCMQGKLTGWLSGGINWLTR